MSLNWYRGMVSTSPTSWDDHDWTIPHAFLDGVERRQDAPPTTLGDHRYLAQSLVSGFELQKALRRRSVTASDPQQVPRVAFASVLRALYEAMAAVPHLFSGVVTSGVDGWVDGYWLLDTAPRHIRRCYTTYSEELTSRLIQGQGWAAGTGVGVVLGIDWEYGEMAGLDPDVLYADALVQVGRIGQALLYVGQQHRLAGRMTPAVHESTGTDMFELSDDRDCLYFLRLAKQRPPVE